MGNHPPKSSAIAVSAVALALAASLTAVRAQTPAATYSSPAAKPTATYSASKGTEETRHASKLVSKALEVVGTMKSNPEISTLLQKSKGVFLLPDYGRAALIVGGQGGAGILLHQDGRWSGPAFYNMGGVSIGAQAGVSSGQIALILMDDRALRTFGQDNKFSLNADAGLTIVNYSSRAHGELGRGDVVVWSDTEGLFANASISVTDIHYDENATHAYYNLDVLPHTVISGGITDRKAANLLAAMPG